MFVSLIARIRIVQLVLCERQRVTTVGLNLYLINYPM